MTLKFQRGEYVTAKALGTTFMYDISKVVEYSRQTGKDVNRGWELKIFKQDKPFPDWSPLHGDKVDEFSCDTLREAKGIAQAYEALEGIPSCEYGYLNRSTEAVRRYWDPITAAEIAAYDAEVAKYSH